MEEDVKALEAGRSDYRMVRELAHLLANDCAEFETGGSVEPGVVQTKVFRLAQEWPPSRSRRAAILEQAARELSTATALSPEETLDLPDQHTLTTFAAPDPAELLQRFELAQAQGMLYRAYNLVQAAAEVHQAVRPDADGGRRRRERLHPDDGRSDQPVWRHHPLRLGSGEIPARPAARHALGPVGGPQAPAKPNLAWVDKDDEEWSFQLTSEDGYVSHYAAPKEHDSAPESGFAERFDKLHTPWNLEREVDLVSVPGGVIIPDFRLVDSGGRSVLQEIVGYWRPEYLRKKFELLHRSGRADVIVAVSERLNLEKAGVRTDDFGERVMFFKGVLNPKLVLELAEGMARAS